MDKPGSRATPTLAHGHRRHHPTSSGQRLETELGKARSGVFQIQIWTCGSLATSTLVHGRHLYCSADLVGSISAGDSAGGGGGRGTELGLRGRGMTRWVFKQKRDWRLTMENMASKLDSSSVATGENNRRRRWLEGKGGEGGVGCIV
ncbi:hypothetical protein NL676_020396 [Syzygium grande]|nr:hypothetical protein NL676_020396 [Syzygium grande]